MKQKLTRIVCGTVLCCTSLLASAQTGGETLLPGELYHEGAALYQQKAFAAAQTSLQRYLQLTSRASDPAVATQRQEAAYMVVCTAYELNDARRIDLLRQYLQQYPGTPHAYRIHGLIASSLFYEQQYAEALDEFAAARLHLLDKEERADMTYRMALCHLQTGNLQEAAIWLETLRATSPRHEADCSYYLAYIRYTQKRYDEALQVFNALRGDEKYRALVPYYIAEIQLLRQDYAEAERVARAYLKQYPGRPHEAEMHRILGAACYHTGRYHEAMNELAAAGSDRRDALYMQGLSAYHCGVYSQVPALLGEVTKERDALGQNAYLHMGLAYLQTGDHANARMAFEQAAASDADLGVKERAAYNHALCIHETSYSAFGESVTVFEKFLNRFPQSVYADRVSRYLVEVYMNTRSYDAALQSINRIGRPGAAILEAKQKILFQLGTQSFANADFPKALGFFEQSLQLGGQYNKQTQADACYWAGESEYRMNRYDRAEGFFINYLRNTPQRDTEMVPLAYYNLGYIAFHRQRYAQAEERFTACLRYRKALTPDVQADASNRLGDCCLRVRRFDEARAYYNRALQLYPSVGDYSYYQLALVAGLQKDYNGKVQLLNQLAQKYPQSPYTVNALYEKGRSYVQTGHTAQAIHTFNQLVERHPESPLSRKALAENGLLYYQSDDLDRAIDTYKQVITRYPGSEEARISMRDLKSIFVEANRVDEFAALAANMSGAIRFEAGEQDSLTYVAAEKVYMRGDIAQAKNSFDRYLQSYPQGAFSLNSHYYLSVIAKSGKDEEAILTHTAVLLQYPGTPYLEEALLMHAEVLFNRRQYAEALADYHRLQAGASTVERRRLGVTGVMRCAALTGDDAEVINSATALLSEAKLSPEQQNEALYFRAKAYLNQKAVLKAEADFAVLAADTRTLYGAEAKYQVAQLHYNAGRYAEAEKEVLNYIEQSTPHAYWPARAFVLLSDVYVAMDKKLDARQYLLSLQQNYQADDDIAAMIEERLLKLKMEN